jgi:catecholate siderophore receptor
LGTKWDLLKQRLLLTAAIFHTEKLNARTSGLNPGDPSIVLDGKQIVRGIEVGAVGAITKEWQVFAGYTFLHTDVEASNTASEEGAQFSNAPEHSANLWTTYLLPWNLEVGTGVQYVGERLNNLSSNANVREAPDYWLFDAMLGFQATQQLTLRLNVYNLADERYIDRVGGGHFVPGPGRSAILTASLNF